MQMNGEKERTKGRSHSPVSICPAVCTGSKSASGPDAVVGIPNDQLADYVNADLTAEVPQDLYADQDFPMQPSRHVM